jgi:hypothetical protein
MENGPQKNGINKEKFRVKCASCHKDVEVVLNFYGGGYVATCPDRGKLAYNEESKPASI